MAVTIPNCPFNDPPARLSNPVEDPVEDKTLIELKWSKEVAKDLDISDLQKIVAGVEWKVDDLVMIEDS